MHFELNYPFKQLSAILTRHIFLIYFQNDVYNNKYLHKFPALVFLLVIFIEPAST